MSLHSVCSTAVLRDLKTYSCYFR